jgi:hypothetical protein
MRILLPAIAMIGPALFVYAGTDGNPRGSSYDL